MTGRCTTNRSALRGLDPDIRAPPLIRQQTGAVMPATLARSRGNAHGAAGTPLIVIPCSRSAVHHACHAKIGLFCGSRVRPLRFSTFEMQMSDTTQPRPGPVEKLQSSIRYSLQSTFLVALFPSDHGAAAPRRQLAPRAVARNASQTSVGTSVKLSATIGLAVPWRTHGALGRAGKHCRQYLTVIPHNTAARARATALAVRWPERCRCRWTGNWGSSDFSGEQA